MIGGVRCNSIPMQYAFNAFSTEKDYEETAAFFKVRLLVVPRMMGLMITT